VRVEGDKKYVVFQVWEFTGVIYQLPFYFVDDRGAADCVTHAMRTRYYAIDTGTLMQLMVHAGFVDVQRLDGTFFQPVIIGTRTCPPN